MKLASHAEDISRSQALWDVLRLPFVDEFDRPFVCNGLPSQCRVLIVGLNPATKLKIPFCSFRTDEGGFNKRYFLEVYAQDRGLPFGQFRGNRARIEKIASELNGLCLETNLYSHPTKTAKELQAARRNSIPFDIIFNSVRPEIVIAHSDEVVKKFTSRSEALTQTIFESVEVRNSHYFNLISLPGPLYTRSFDDVTIIGRRIAQVVRAI